MIEDVKRIVMKHYVKIILEKYNIDSKTLKETVTAYGAAGAGKVDTSIFSPPERRGSPEEEKEKQ
jgi:deoxyribose-phosphate aldolase